MRVTRLLCLVFAVLGVSCVGCPPAGATATAPPRAVVNSTCALPEACRLREAGAASGVKVGFGVGYGDPAHQSTVLAEANVSVNHQFSWVGIEPERGAWNFAKADAEYQFALDHGLYQIGMHFAWDQDVLDDMPGWVGSITDPDELRAVLRERAEVLFARYPKLNRIDVINEPFETLGSKLYANHFAAVLGPDYIFQLFEIVQAVAPPSVELFVNETGIEYQPDKADSLVALVADLKQRGARVDAVGLQSHMDVGEPNWPVYLSTMQRLAALGTKPFISEIDIPVPIVVPDRANVQARRYRQATQTCLAVPACDLIDTWGVSDSESWLNGSLYPGLNPLLFDDRYQPKPAYYAVRDALLTGRLDPATLNTTTEQPLVSGQADVVYALECRPQTELVESGLPRLSSVARMFIAGNPLRIPMPAHLTWNPSAAAGGVITYGSDLTLDLSTLATRYLEETARPAVGLGGYPELVPTVSIRLRANDVTITQPTSPGILSFGQPTVTSNGPSASVLVDDTAVTTKVGPLVGDSRAPAPSVTLRTSWTARTAASEASATIDLRPPSVTFTMTVDLGVVAGAFAVGGNVRSPFACTTTGTVPIPRSTLSATATPAVTNALSPVPAAPVTAMPSFTG